MDANPIHVAVAGRMMFKRVMGKASFCIFQDLLNLFNTKFDISLFIFCCKVKVLDMEYDEEMDFQLVGSTEANSLQGKISNESPVGKALIGAKQGDVVDVELADGDIMQYKVLKIERNI